MSVGFGFSVGDFLAALKLVGTVIDSLRSTGDSSTHYRDLITELYTLEDSLIRVKRIELDDSQNAERIALHQAAAQCQRSIDKFMTKVEKYQPHLRSGGSSNKAKDAWMKVKWAVCRKDDVESFRAELRGHRGAIEVLLMTLQMQRSSIQAQTQDKQHMTLVGKIQDVSFQWMGMLSGISNNITRCLDQGKQMIEATANVLRTNIQVFQIVCNIQQIITRLPGQIDRQQPVYMIDALGKASPFHLEFVRSSEALIAVLKINFQHTATGVQKIEMGEFAIQDNGTQQDIDLKKPWDHCFFPGQKVVMSMFFEGDPKNTANHCPRCHTESQGGTGQEVECANCGMVFCRVVDPALGLDRMAPPPFPSATPRSYQKRWAVQGPASQPSRSSKRKREEDADVDILNFRRVRIKRLDSSRYRCKVYRQGTKEVGYEDQDWRDFGTGTCKVITRRKDNEYRRTIVVEAERHSANIPRSVLIHKDITSARDNSFKRTKENVIIWIDPGHVEDHGLRTRGYVAISFAEVEGCQEIWDYIDHVQKFEKLDDYRWSNDLLDPRVMYSNSDTEAQYDGSSGDGGESMHGGGIDGEPLMVISDQEDESAPVTEDSQSGTSDEGSDEEDNSQRHRRTAAWKFRYWQDDDGETGSE